MLVLLQEFRDAFVGFVERVGQVMRFGFQLLKLMPRGVLRVAPIVEQI